MTSIETNQIETSPEIKNNLSKEVNQLTSSVSNKVNETLSVLESIKWEWWIPKTIQNLFWFMMGASLNPEKLTEEIIKKREEINDTFKA